MSIHVVCPNGHSLKVKESCAGRIGRCPVCKAPVKIPALAVQSSNRLSEDAILGILGPHDPGRSRNPVATDRSQELGSEYSAEEKAPSPPKKSCQHCNREISAGTHICPHCHTYIAGLKDF